MKHRQDKQGAFQTFKSLFNAVGIIPGIKRWLRFPRNPYHRSGVFPTKPHTQSLTFDAEEFFASLENNNSKTSVKQDSFSFQMVCKMSIRDDK